MPLVRLNIEEMKEDLECVIDLTGEESIHEIIHLHESIFNFEDYWWWYEGEELFPTAKELANIEKDALRYDLKCSRCPPNKGDNATRKAKHGPKKPKHKDKRK